MNKILYINGKFESTRLTGVQRVGVELAYRLQTELRQRHVKCVFVRPPKWIGKSKFRPLLAFLWEQLVLSFKARDGMLVNLCNTAPILSWGRQVVVLHDAAVVDVPENYSKFYAGSAKFQMWCFFLRRDYIFTVSDFSRLRLQAAFRGVISDNAIVKEGCNHVLSLESDDAILDHLKISKDKYFLAVGSQQAGKNFGNLLRAIELLSSPIPLVVVGGGDSIVFCSGVQLTSSKYIHAGYVTDKELKSLYTNALVFIQSSTYEGFGLPVLEAMALGTAVVCSEAASLPEVCGPAARYFDPYSPEQMAAVLQEVVNDELSRTRMVFNGLARAKNFDWDVSARDFANKIVALGCSAEQR